MLKSWTAPAAPPLARVWERLGQPRRRVLTAPREGRRGEGEEEEEERRGWLPARNYLKPGWSPGGGEGIGERAVPTERSALGCGEMGDGATRVPVGRGVGMGPGVSAEGLSAADAAARLSRVRLSLLGAVTAGRTGLPPEGLPLPGAAGGKVAHGPVPREL